MSSSPPPEGGERSRVFVSGASGFLGRALVPALAAAGFRPVRLVRRPAGAGPDALPWDPAAGLAEPAALEDAAAVIHLSGENLGSGRWTAARKARFRESRIRSTRTLAETIAGLDRPPVAFLTASATGYYGDRGDEVLTEESSAGTGFLADLCREWEAAAVPARAAGVRCTALRFGVMFAPGSAALAKMLPPFRLGLGAVLGDGRQWMSWVDREDAVAACLWTLTRELEGPVNVVAPEAVTNREFTRTLARVLKRPAFLAAPATVLRVMLGEMARETILSSQRAVPARLEASGFRFLRPGLEETLRRAVGG